MNVHARAIITALVSASLLAGACEEVASNGSASTGAPPPADAEYLDTDTTPSAVMLHVARVKQPQQAQAAADLKGMWVPATGWTAPVEAVNDQRGGTTLGLKFSTSAIIGGEFWVIAPVPLTDRVKAGDTVTVQGKIQDIEVKYVGPVPTYRIILEQARILEHQKRRAVGRRGRDRMRTQRGVAATKTVHRGHRGITEDTEKTRD